ncbi:hypothetical protein M3Y95_00355100 [Aphelenchoides besseyi]|nr:hypothetical protein M3Y95_00355100 [Aphelenchoides besseyi]
MVVNVTIGTPGQSLVAWLNQEGFYNDLKVPDSRTGGTFDPSASTTFVKTGDYYDYDGKTIIGVIGTDNFQIGNGESKNKSFKVTNIQSGFDEDFGQIGFARSNNNSASFIESILSDLDEKIVVFSFDSVQGQYPTLSSGMITLGSRPADRCADDWIVVPEHVYDDETFEQWAVEIDELSIGKYSYTQPGQTLISFFESSIIVPETYYDQICNALHVDGMGNVDCDIQTEIVFTIGKQEIRMPPEEYLVQSSQSGNCVVNIEVRFGSENFVLPSYVLRRHCLLYDYSGINVGFSTRLPH